MKITQLKIEGSWQIEFNKFSDDRGYFFESYNERDFRNNGIKVDFVQDNESKSVRGVIRGLHFQHPPFAQSKLVRVTLGEVLDVAIDIRKGSPTYGKQYSVRLKDLLKRGDISANVPMKPGDIIIVPQSWF